MYINLSLSLSLYLSLSIYIYIHTIIYVILRDAMLYYSIVVVIVSHRYCHRCYCYMYSHPADKERIRQGCLYLRLTARRLAKVVPSKQ